MSNKFADYKNAFRITLDPIMDLLEYKRSQLPEKEWMQFIEATKLSIISNPEQFLGKELPTPLLLQQAIQEIFTEYLEDQRVAV